MKGDDNCKTVEAVLRFLLVFLQLTPAPIIHLNQ